MHTATEPTGQGSAKKPKKVSVRKFQAEIDAPSGVSFELHDKMLKVKGPNGVAERKFDYAYIKFDVTQNKIIMKATRITKREKRMIGTFRSHIRNMIKGQTQIILYRIKICSSHFPMQVTIAGEIMTLKNFAGERFPRTLKIAKGVEIKINGDIIEVSSHDKELAGKVAGQIEHLTLRPEFDNRVFQDGLFLIEKDGKPIK